MTAAKGSILVFVLLHIGKVEYHYYLKIKRMKQRKSENADDVKQITNGNTLRFVLTESIFCYGEFCQIVYILTELQMS
ncbi:hypothetical protein T4C_6957, partial [Trichinella pseudospiralis]